METSPLNSRNTRFDPGGSLEPGLVEAVELERLVTRWRPLGVFEGSHWGDALVVHLTYVDSVIRLQILV